MFSNRWEFFYKQNNEQRKRASSHISIILTSLGANINALKSGVNLCGQTFRFPKTESPD